MRTNRNEDERVSSMMDRDHKVKYRDKDKVGESIC